jgi:ribonuclease J
VSGVEVTVLGGLNEVGGNKVLVDDDGDRLLLDFGAALGSRGDFFEEYLSPRTPTALAELLGLDLLPHVDGLYRRDLVDLAEPVVPVELPESGPAYRQRTGEDAVHGVLVTHAHADHVNDAAFLDPEIPLYCTRTTRTLLETIDDLQGRGVEDEIVTVRERSIGELSDRATFPGEPTVRSDRRQRRIEVCPEDAWFRVGPFRARAIPVDHSVPGAVAFLVETPSGARIFYTGDVRFHGRLTGRTETLRETVDGLEPDLVVTEGTRVTEEAGDDEAAVEADVRDLVDRTDGLALAEFGWKDTTRFDTLQRVADATERTLLVDPKLAYLLHRVHHLSEVPSQRVDAYDHVRVRLPPRGTHRYAPSDYTRAKHEAGLLADWDTKALRAAWASDDEVTLRDPLEHWREGVRAPDVREAPDEYLVHLSYYDAQELFDLDPPDGSRWVRCRTEPFSDEMELDLERQCNWLDRFGLEHNVPPTGSLGGLTHVSGHAAGADLLELVESAGADTVLPVHTEAAGLDVFEDALPNAVTFPDLQPRDAVGGRATVEL